MERNHQSERSILSASAQPPWSWSETIRDERVLIVLCLPLFTTILVTTLIRRLHPEEEDD